MAENLNVYFSSVFTKRILVHYQFQIQHFRKTPEMVAKKIKAMKDNKSPGVDGIPPKLLMETVEQISMPLARTFKLSLKEGVVPFELIEGKKQTSYQYLKRVQGISQIITDQ